MVDGFKVTLTGQQLAEHLNGRVKHHASRVEFYAGERERLKSVSDTEVYQNSIQGPLQSMDFKISSHKETAAKFSFFATYLDRTELYRITEHEAKGLELIK